MPSMPYRDKSEEHLIKRCPAYSDLRAQFHIESLQLCMTTGDQRRMGHFITAAYERQEQMLQRTRQTQSTQQTPTCTQQTITQFFRRLEPHTDRLAFQRHRAHARAGSSTECDADHVRLGTNDHDCIRRTCPASG
ncbi:hypothetical protein KP509_11G091800 [Ceratopteris richardii]|uniref:Uncharacterized protein n=1 Tax=Ceratopteris richardii TaxID=49495 RepID=A0A8T2TX52_CERRI|nr:hypothetical protein KP509_11G091800 [Ceratopteris richardii]